MSMPSGEPGNQDLSDEHELAMLGEFVEACAWEDHYQAAPEYIRWEQGLQTDHLASAVVLSQPFNSDPFYNRVLGLGLNEPAEEWMLDELLAFIWDTGTQNLIVHLTPQSQPPELHDWLRWRGFWLEDRHAKFIHDATPPQHSGTDLRIELTGSDFGDAFAFVVTEAFGLPDYMYPWLRAEVGRPNWRHYVAWDGETPAAAGALYQCGEAAWLGHGCTLPAYRRRGTQAAILARRIQDGADLGIKWFITDTAEDLPEQPNPSYRNMLRSGFKLAYLRWNYRFQAY